MADKNDVLVAIETGSGLLDDGTEVRWTKGRTRVRANHAIAKKWPNFFAESDADYPEIEEATKDPGKKRGQ